MYKTIISLILAGKVGSNIASELGTMRVTEQIDALDVMGVNSVGYLVGPKILAALFIFPIVIVIIIFMIVRVYVVGKNLLIVVVFAVEMNHSVKTLKQ